MLVEPSRNVGAYVVEGHIGQGHGHGCILSLRRREHNPTANPDPHAHGTLPVMATLDHLVYATNDLDRTVAHLTERFGVAPKVGGSHLNWGTRNQLLSFGNGTYFEIIGPDPSLPEPEQPRPFGVDHIAGESLVAWAVAVTDIDAACAASRRRGYDPGPAVAMQRATADGALLSWRLTTPPLEEFDGLVPFLLDWGSVAGSPMHPSASAPKGIRLLSLRAEHPSPDRVNEALGAIDAPLTVGLGAAPRLFAEIDTPNGPVTLT